MGSNVDKTFICDLAQLHPATQVAAVIMIGIVVCVIAYGIFVKN